MDVWRITVAVLRRWYVFLPLLALTALAVMGVNRGIEPQYEVVATAVLVPGRVDSETENPYGTMNSTNEVLSIVLNNSTSRAEIEQQGLDPTYELSARSSSRIMDVSVVSDSPEVGTATAEAVLEMVRSEIATRQEAAGITEDAQIGIQVLQAPSVVDEVSQGRTRAMAIVGVVGAAASVLVTVLLDDIVGLLRRLRGSWRRPRTDGTHDDTGQEHA